MADQAINALSTKTAPETSDQLLLVGAGEPQLIDYDKLADAILNKITSKNYALDAGTMTLLAALNALNGNSLHRLDIEDDTTETIGKPVETLRNNIEKFQSSSDIVYFGFIQCGMRAQYIGFTILENQYASFLIYSYGTDLVQLKRINGKWE